MLRGLVCLTVVTHGNYTFHILCDAGPPDRYPSSLKAFDDALVSLMNPVKDFWAHLSMDHNTVGIRKQTIANR